MRTTNRSPMTPSPIAAAETNNVNNPDTQAEPSGRVGKETLVSAHADAPKRPAKPANRTFFILTPIWCRLKLWRLHHLHHRLGTYPKNQYTTLLQDTPPLPSPPALRAGGEARGEAPIHFNCAPIDGLLFCRGLWRFRMEATVTALNPLDGTSHCRRRRHRHRESFHLVRPAKVRGGLSAPQSFHSCWPRLCPHRGL